MRLKVSSAKRRPFCLGLYELINRVNGILYRQVELGMLPFYRDEECDIKRRILYFHLIFCEKSQYECNIHDTDKTTAFVNNISILFRTMWWDVTVHDMFDQVSCRDHLYIL